MRGTNNKPVASELLAELFESERMSDGGELFIGYPVTPVANGRSIDAVYVSASTGVVVFDLVEGNNLGDYQDRQDDGATALEVRLKQHRDLMDRRVLMVPLHAVTFAPAIGALDEPTDPDYPVANTDSLRDVLRLWTWPAFTPDLYRRTISALQSISGIRRSATTRVARRPDSRGDKLKHLEGSIATLDAQQSRAVIETARDVQRIRGLAGSGKTVVLALKAAYLHAQHPDWQIAVTFQTRSLRGQFRRLINNFTIEQTGDEPDWSKLQILPSWGAPGGGAREGVYHLFCMHNEVIYRDFNAARREFGAAEPLAGACEAALGEAKELKPSFDVILVDEAQDLPPAFLRMCYFMLGAEKRLVYAYDELQTLNGAGLPTPEQIFGHRPNGQPRVTFGFSQRGEAQRDIILERCYRNSRPVLVTAHGLGFGIYRQPPRPGGIGLVQIFEQKTLWHEIGYVVAAGQLEDGHDVTLIRTEESSPRFLEDHSPITDLIQFHRFKTVDEQNEWVAEQIRINLTTDELVPNDIIVINPNPLTTRSNVGTLRKGLFDRDIDSHLAGVDTTADIFFQPDRESVTVTGVHRAKGNEAGMVYVVNAQENLAETANLARIRNRLFTAITRSKAWVRVCGVGEQMDDLVGEFDAVKVRDFALAFRYPTEAERATMQILHRDMSAAHETRVRRYDQSVGDLVADIEAGEVFVEDLDPQTLERLANLLRKKNG